MLKKTTSSLRAALTAFCFLSAALTALPAAADSVQLQVLKRQLTQLEQLGATDAADSLREVIASMEEDEASSETSQPSETVRGTYFAEQGQSNLESCDSGEFQYDSICAAAMLRYQDFLVASGNGTSKEIRDELWRRHAETAKVYLQSVGR